VSKFTGAERTLVKSIVASLSIKRIPDPDLTNEVLRQTDKTLSRTGLYRIRQQIKKESVTGIRQGEKDSTSIYTSLRRG
jgi:hypothetical protein